MKGGSDVWLGWVWMIFLRDVKWVGWAGTCGVFWTEKEMPGGEWCIDVDICSIITIQNCGQNSHELWWFKKSWNTIRRALTRDYLKDGIKKFSHTLNINHLETKLLPEWMLGIWEFLLHRSGLHLVGTIDSCITIGTSIVSHL